jgi:hypothetical protein
VKKERCAVILESLRFDKEQNDPPSRRDIIL